MLDLPKPILGNITAITITTPDLEKSLAYYEKLGFSLVQRADWPFPWIQVSDGALLIMLRKDPKPYIALTYYVNDIDTIAAGIEKKGMKFTQKPKKGEILKRYILQSPDGLTVSLVGITEGFTQPKGPVMLHMKQEDYFNPGKYVNKTAGMYGEMAHPVTDLDASVTFWEKLGFKALSKFTSPYPWAILSDGLSVVGLHQTTHFSFPAITYFASDMAEKIAALKKKGLKNYKDQGPANTVLTTPEGQHIFLYSMGGGQQMPEQKKKELVTPVIETKRLILREVTPGTLDTLYTSYSDDEIMAFLGLKNAEELKVEKSKWEGGLTTFRISLKMFLITEKESGKVIGGCAFHNWYDMHKRSEIGYHINDDAFKNKGYMKEALKAILTFGFEKMELNRVEAFIGPANEPSLRLVKGLGFTEEGRLREHYCKDGELQDSVCFGLLKSEYRKVKKTWGKE